MTKTPSARGLENVSPTSSVECNNKLPYDQTKEAELSREFRT